MLKVIIRNQILHLFQKLLNFREFILFPVFLTYFPNTNLTITATAIITVI